MCDDEKINEKLIGIEKKSDRIELLINNLFNATLEELQELEVKCTEESSQAIKEIILLADYSNLIDDFFVPACIIRCDKLRLGQVFDNIISNSYKYAGTKIHVSCEIIDNALSISIADEGRGLDEDEISRCCEKFYRGKNAEGKNGSGLGLYISSFFCEKMGGGLEVKNEKGFTVRVFCPLAK